MRRIFQPFIPWTITALFAAPVALGAEEKVRRNVEIEFETVEGATLYEVQVMRKDDRSRAPLRFKTKTPKWSATIKPGVYEMQIRSFDLRGAPGDWSSPTEIEVKLPAIIAKAPTADMVIKAKSEKEENVRMAWEAIPGANGYKLTVTSSDGSVKLEKDSGSPEWSGDLPVGHQYNWNVSAIDYRGQAGEMSSDPYKFELHGPALRKPRITKPISKYVKQMVWQASPHAEHYSYVLSRYNSRAKKWDQIEANTDFKDTTLPMDISRPSGRYFLTVQAHANYWDSSEKAQMEFYMEGGFDNAGAFENAILRDSIMKPSRYYAIASYLITQIEYRFSDRDNLSNSTFNALGGTGRLGAGYQDPRSFWGGFAILDLSGFVIEGQRFLFSSAEGHITRKLEFGQGGLLLFGTGVFMKELPAVKGSPEDGFYGVGKVRGIGPHAGFSYWFPLTARLGMQTNARAYYTMMGSETNGRDVSAALSYQVGLLGSYRLARAWMGYAGYAYRKDEANFDVNAGDSQSFAQAGQTNTVSIVGHYLNLLLEWSF